MRKPLLVLPLLLLGLALWNFVDTLTNATRSHYRLQPLLPAQPLPPTKGEI